ncbi:uncharacterized protein K02A2.6-like [Bombus bifarius]|uniref:RNA-directed DNA polymerase n=1 Tax=Bombus bifarius TaxID=103933 RepID=A0A6P8NDP6_9HYME|nr:uncharacterized protein K02A2.6-like [Bombus bifarius]
MAPDSAYSSRFVALVDTGSDLTFIRSDEYARLGSPPLGKCTLKFDGVGSAGNETWGEFTKSDKPVVRRPRRLAPSEKKEVDELMELWTNEGTIKPSNSEYASPIVVVRKKDGSIRVCVDFRELNELIECPHFPLPLIDDILDALQGTQFFTTLDLKNGFFHVCLDKDSRKYTSFVTPSGQYEFLKLPFGLKISPIVFQKYISMIFKELVGKGIVIVYMDDIIILAKNLEEAWERLQMVIELAEQYGLIINWGKCRFLQQEIEYLGYIVSKNTIRPSTHKTRAVANFPKPTSVKKVQSFLGLTGYFRKFIRGYAKIAKPLTDLLKKEVKFQFGDREVEAFEILKTALVNEPVLKLYRMGAETELHTDASAEGYGAILMQLDLDDGKFHPVYFASGKTTPAEAKYTSYELEVLAIVKALNKFRIYLLECRDDVLIVVPKAMQVQVVRQAHERGHFGVTKTEAIVKKDFWFKGLREKVEHVVSNCLDCILAERKLGKQEGYLNPLDKGDTPLDTYHIDHAGPMTATKKRYAHIFVVVDAFTKFTWLYPTRSTDTADVIDRLKKQAAVFGNPRRIISDRGTAFTSNAFQEYCEEENMKHLLVTTGAPRGNGQVERVNRTLIPLLTKLTAPKPDDWYKHVDQVQKYLNFTLNRSTGKTPFLLLAGVEMQTKEDPQIRKLVQEEWVVENCCYSRGKSEALQQKKKRCETVPKWRVGGHKENAVWPRIKTGRKIFGSVPDSASNAE